jgi:hypothetical protein
MSNSYYQKNKATILAKLKKKRQELTPEQKEAKKIYAKNYYQENKAKRLQQQKEYALTDKGIAVRKKANSKWYKKNKDYLLAKSKENWRKSKLAILQGNNL